MNEMNVFSKFDAKLDLYSVEFNARELKTDSNFIFMKKMKSASS